MAPCMDSVMVDIVVDVVVCLAWFSNGTAIQRHSNKTVLHPLDVARYGKSGMKPAYKHIATKGPRDQKKSLEIPRPCYSSHLN